MIPQYFEFKNLLKQGQFFGTQKWKLAKFGPSTFLFVKFALGLKITPQICEILKNLWNFEKFVKFWKICRSSLNMCLLHEGWRKTEDPIKQMLIKQELIKHDELQVTGYNLPSKKSEL